MSIDLDLRPREDAEDVADGDVAEIADDAEVTEVP